MLIQVPNSVVTFMFPRHLATRMKVLTRVFQSRYSEILALGEHRFQVYTTIPNLKLLALSPDALSDGTFKVPKDFYQVSHIFFYCKYVFSFSTKVLMQTCQIYVMGKFQESKECGFETFHILLTNVIWVMEFLTCRYKINLILSKKKYFKEIDAFYELK